MTVTFHRLSTWRRGRATQLAWCPSAQLLTARRRRCRPPSCRRSPLGRQHAQRTDERRPTASLADPADGPANGRGGRSGRRRGRPTTGCRSRRVDHIERTPDHRYALVDDETGELRAGWYPGVTGILGTVARPGATAWIRRVTAATALDELDALATLRDRVGAAEATRWLAAASERVAADAASRGGGVHAILERLAQGVDPGQITARSLRRSSPPGRPGGRRNGADVPGHRGAGHAQPGRAVRRHGRTRPARPRRCDLAGRLQARNDAAAGPSTPPSRCSSRPWPTLSESAPAGIGTEARSLPPDLPGGSAAAATRRRLALRRRRLRRAQRAAFRAVAVLARYLADDAPRAPMAADDHRGHAASPTAVPFDFSAPMTLVEEPNVGRRPNLCR